MITLAASNLGALDWAVIGGYLLLLLGSGIWFARREPDGAGEYFLANRRMPAWAVAFSIIAASLSVATFMGAPESAYKSNMTFLSTTIGTLIAVAVVAGAFIPAFYANNVTTVYGLLEKRFGPKSKQAASATFMIGRLFASGARVYMAAIPLAMVLFGVEQSTNAAYLAGAILVLTAVAVAYTLIGGIASVIWTDVLQTLVLVGAAVGAVVILLHKIPMPLSEIWTALHTPDPNGNYKTTVLVLGLNKNEPNLGFDPSARYTVLTAVFGFSLINMAAYGTDHDLAQRMLTCKSAIRGSMSAWTAIILNLPITLLFMTIGMLLFVFYRLVAAHQIDAQALTPGQEAFPSFILQEMPRGLAGLMLAGLFAAGLGSLNSAINAMAATFINDFYMPAVKGKTDRHYLLASRWATAAWGAAVGLFAVACIFWKRANPDTTLIDFALQVMTFAYAGLLAVFLTAIFTRRGNTTSSLASLATGFIVIILFQTWGLWTPVVNHVLAGTAPDGSPLPPTIGALKLAYPWQMLVATVISFIVCCAGRRSEDLTARESSTKASNPSEELLP
jgi:SSS family transporter